DRVVLQQELIGIHAAPVEADVVAAARRKRYRLVQLLPGAALMKVTWMGAELEIRQLLLEVRSAWVEPGGVGRPEIQRHMVDAVETLAIHVPERIAQIDARPGRPAPLVGIVKDDPVCVTKSAGESLDFGHQRP